MSAGSVKVIHNPNVVPNVVVTAFFDRRERSAVKVSFDEQSDALYLRLDQGPVAESEEVHPGVVLDYDENDQVIGVEILGLATHIDRAQLRSIFFEVT